MIKNKTFPAYLCFLSLLCGLMFLPSLSHAQIEGCNPEVMEAMEATAEARVAVSNSVDDQIFTQDESVLAMSCFNQSASILGNVGGQVFSGEFGDVLGPIIQTQLLGHFDNFMGSVAGAPGATGALSSSPLGEMGSGLYTVGATFTNDNIPSDFQCDGLGATWAVAENKGVATGVPYMTLGDIANGGGAQLGSAGNDFTRNLTAANDPAGADIAGILSRELGDLQTPQIRTFTAAETPCQVMIDVAQDAIDGGATGVTVPTCP